jgi:hypothetical protein
MGESDHAGAEGGGGGWGPFLDSHSVVPPHHVHLVGAKPGGQRAQRGATGDRSFNQARRQSPAPLSRAKTPPVLV